MQHILMTIALVFAMASCGNELQKETEMNTETNTTEVTRAAAQQTLASIGEALGTGNMNVLDKTISAGYIQHDPFCPDSLSGLKQYFTAIGEKFPDLSFEPKGIFADGNMAFFLSYQKYNAEHAGVFILDIWRYDGNMLQEHWDITQDVVKSELHDNDMVFNYVPSGNGNTENSKKIAQLCLESLGEALGTGNMDALGRVIPENYIQHDPFSPDGLAGLKTYFSAVGKNYPNFAFEPKGIFADGDIVFFLSYQKYNEDHAGVFVVDIWRIEDDKVIEHWDITQDVVESELHNNPMVFGAE